jgi:hypothetical protein
MASGPSECPQEVPRSRLVRVRFGTDSADRPHYGFVTARIRVHGGFTHAELTGNASLRGTLRRKHSKNRFPVILHAQAQLKANPAMKAPPAFRWGVPWLAALGRVDLAA